MKKIISFVGMFAVMGAVFGDAHGVAMSANIRRLLQEKQDKIAKLEECEGKKQGWMIAGISTIGLTAVGVGVNIAQASKSNRLSDEIEMEKTTLQRQQDELDRINNKIADERAKQAKKGGNDSPVYVPAGDAGNSPADVDIIEPFCGKVINYRGETYPYAIISCVANGGIDYNPEPKNGKAGVYDDAQGGIIASVDNNGEFCFKISVPRGAKCSLGSSEMNTLTGTIEDLVRYKDGIMMCRYLTSGILPIGTNCRVDGKIGETCGDGGVWSVADNGNKLCDNGRVVKCECVKQATETGSQIRDKTGKVVTENEWVGLVKSFNEKIRERDILRREVVGEESSSEGYSVSFKNAKQSDYDALMLGIDQVDREITALRNNL